MSQTLTVPRRAAATTRADDPSTVRQLARACLVELRSLLNTRAGIALAVGAVLGIGVFAGGRAAFPADDTALGVLVTMASWPGGLAAMVASVLLVTNEFSTGTISATLALQPRRGIVLTAKALVVTGLVLLVTAVALLAGVLMVLVVPLVTGQDLQWTLSLARIAAGTGVNLLTCLAALAWGLVARNAAAPIVLLLVWPTLSSLMSAVSPRVGELLAYLSLDAPFAVANAQPGAVLQLLTASLVWVLLPGIPGARHWLRADMS